MSESAPSETLNPIVHARGEANRLDAVLDLIRFVARPCPLSVALDELPQRIAALFRCDVCSIYLLEGDELVMRGNVGFPAQALGEVRLAVGTGITGMAVEVMRPISLDAACSHTAYRHFPVLEGERFPVFMAMPIAGPRGPLGALVLRRRTRPAFELGDLELAAALTAPIAAVVERANLNAALRRRAGNADASRPLATRRVTLPGRPATPGRAVGPLHLIPRPSAQSSRTDRTVPDPSTAQAALQRVISRTRRNLEALENRGRELGLELSFLHPYHVMLEDARLQGRVLEHVKAGSSLSAALGRAGAEAVRGGSLSHDEFGFERARAIDDLCEAMAMLANGEAETMPRHPVLGCEEITLYDLLVSERCQPRAVVLAGPLTSHASSLLALLGAPAVAEVVGLFRWAAQGELLLVDGDHGLVRINPGRAELSTARAARKERKLETGG